jgi:peptide/nickel transport system permease protein
MAKKQPPEKLPATPGTAPARAGALVGESYWDIVWRQFKRNRQAYWALWVLAPVFLVAIFAPAIASNRPFVFRDENGTTYPWFVALFHPLNAVDFVYNMAMIGFFPWALGSLAGNFWARRRGVPGRTRLWWSAIGYLAVILALCIVFAIPRFVPKNPDARRVYVQEQFVKPDQRSGLWPPIAFGVDENDSESRFKPPFYRKPASTWLEVNDGHTHILGTDDGGRDVLARLIHGSRVSMSVGFVAVSIYMSIGIVIGAIAGYFGGLVDITISRIIEIVLLFPSFFLIITLVAFIGPSIWVIMFVIGITGWPTIARLIRGEVLKQRALEYTAAAKALGAGRLRIIFRHVLPNALAPALVAVPFGIAGAIVTEAGLSLLGFGVRPPAASWGSVLQGGYGNYQYYWMIVWPSLAMFGTLTLFNLVGNGLRDAMDPRLRV